MCCTVNSSTIMCIKFTPENKIIIIRVQLKKCTANACEIMEFVSMGRYSHDEN